MPINHVGLDVIPSGIFNNGTARVEGCKQIIGAHCRSTTHSTTWDIPVQAPFLVVKTPQNDRRMIPIAFNHCGQLPLKSARALFAEPARARRLLPDKHSHSIGPVKPEGILEFQVFAHHRETKILRKFKIALKSIESRGGQTRIRPITLVKNAAQEDPTTIEEDRPPFNADLPEARCGRDEIARIAFACRELNMVEIRILRRPKVRMPGLQARLNAPTIIGYCRQTFTGFKQTNLHLLPRSPLPGQLRIDGDRFEIITTQPNRRHVGGSTAFEPDRLPNTRGRSEAHPVIVIPRNRALFPMSDGTFVGGRKHLDLKVMFDSGAQTAGQIELEGLISTDVRSHLLAVDNNPTRVVNSPKTQDWTSPDPA